MTRRKNCKFIPVLAIAAVLCVGTSLPLAAQSSLVLYDNFNSKHIDTSKWGGLQFYDPDVREVVRELAGEDRNRRLHLSQIAYSATTDGDGSSGGGFGLAFPVPGAINEVSFDVVVNKAVAVGCGSNPSGQIVAGAEFRGRFFNTESSPTQPNWGRRDRNWRKSKRDRYWACHGSAGLLPAVRR